MNEQFEKSGRIISINYVKNYVKVRYAHLQEEQEFVLSLETFIQFPLIVNQFVDANLFEQVTETEKFMKFKKVLFSKLSRKDYSYQAILDYFLENKVYTEEEIKKFLLKLESYHLFNDEEYAKSIVQKGICRLKGIKGIEHDLEEQKVDPAIIERTLEHYPVELELENAKKVIEKVKLLYSKSSFFEVKRKIYSKLNSLGYQEPTIHEVLSFLKNEDFSVDQLVRLKNQFQMLKNRLVSENYGKIEKEKIIKKLMNKGFSYSEILLVMKEEDQND